MNNVFQLAVDNSVSKIIFSISGLYYKLPSTNYVINPPNDVLIMIQFCIKTLKNVNDGKIDLTKSQDKIKIPYFSIIRTPFVKWGSKERVGAHLVDFMDEIMISAVFNIIPGSDETLL